MTERKIALSIEDAANYTGIGRNTLRKLVEWEKLPVLKVGRKVLIKTDMLEKFMEGTCNRRFKLLSGSLYRYCTFRRSCSCGKSGGNTCVPAAESGS